MKTKVEITPKMRDTIKKTAMYLTKIQHDKESIDLAYNMWQIYLKL